MCGILGIVGQPPVQGRPFYEALQKMRHRGPDDQGIMLLQGDTLTSFSLPESSPETKAMLPAFPMDSQSNVLLGHLRLSIIDLSTGGHQPFVSRDGRYALVFNGEIYNYRELQTELRLDCATHSDTEVLLQSYIALGPKCVERFVGMWAFAIYDRQTQSLFASRDPFGIKPFYFHQQGDQLLFASEIKALLSFVRPLPCFPAIYNYLVNGIKDYDQSTFFEGIQQLEPGHNLVWRNGQLAVEPYVVLGKGLKNGSEADLKSAFHESMKLHMRSDVPFGVALSGGIDSTVMSAVIASEFPEAKCDYFSGVYPGIPEDTATGKLVDEGPYINETVARYGLESHRVTPTMDYVRNNLIRMIWHVDQPVRAIGVLLNSAIYRSAADEGIKVLLGGQGADETFTGYSDSFAPFLFDLLRRGRWKSFWSEIQSIKGGSDPLIVRHFFRHVATVFLNHLPYSYRKRRRRHRLEALGLYRSDFIDKNVDYDPYLSNPDKDGGVDQLLLRSFRLKLRDYLDYEDKLSMMSSVESRVPFLSLPFVQYGLSIDGNKKIRNGLTKFPLRSAFKDLIPESILNRTNKTGFTSPQGQWLAELGKPLATFLDRPDAFVKQIIRPEAIEKMVGAVRDGRPTDYLLLFRVWSLEIWHRLYVLGTPMAELAESFEPS